MVSLLVAFFKILPLIYIHKYIYIFLSQTADWLYVTSQLNEKVPEICN